MFPDLLFISHNSLKCLPGSIPPTSPVMSISPAKSHNDISWEEEGGAVVRHLDESGEPQWLIVASLEDMFYVVCLSTWACCVISQSLWGNVLQ